MITASLGEYIDSCCLRYLTELYKCFLTHPRRRHAGCRRLFILDVVLNRLEPGTSLRWSIATIMVMHLTFSWAAFLATIRCLIPSPYGISYTWR